MNEAIRKPLALLIKDSDSHRIKEQTQKRNVFFLQCNAKIIMKFKRFGRRNSFLLLLIIEVF